MNEKKKIFCSGYLSLIKRYALQQYGLRAVAAAIATNINNYQQNMLLENKNSNNNNSNKKFLIKNKKIKEARITWTLTTQNNFHQYFNGLVT